ncbi:MAG: acetylglutamate kinase [Candidatus Margulisiibacteriota bacterium]
MFERLIRRAKVVIEALPYLMEFHGKVIVIKYGGSAMHDPELKKSILRDIVFLKYVGMHPVIIHGGGPDITKALKRRKISSKFVKGLRVTTKDIMKVVEYVLGKKVNREIVSIIKKSGGKAKSFCGKKGRVIRAKKQWVKDREGKYVDLGFTGTVDGIRYRFLSKWMKKGYIPVLSPIGVGSGGKTYNINADSAAAAVAAFLKAEKLILLTNVHGVLGKDDKLISEVNAYRIRKMIEQGVISGGMIPKVKCGLYALKKGVEKVHIIDGQIPHALLLELFTDTGIGTMVVK